MIVWTINLSLGANCKTVESEEETMVQALHVPTKISAEILKPQAQVGTPPAWWELHFASKMEVWKGHCSEPACSPRRAWVHQTARMLSSAVLHPLPRQHATLQPVILLQVGKTSQICLFKAQKQASQHCGAAISCRAGDKLLAMQAQAWLTVGNYSGWHVYGIARSDRGGVTNLKVQRYATQWSCRHDGFSSLNALYPKHK